MHDPWCELSRWENLAVRANYDACEETCRLKASDCTFLVLPEIDRAAPSLEIEETGPCRSRELSMGAIWHDEMSA